MGRQVRGYTRVACDGLEVEHEPVRSSEVADDLMVEWHDQPIGKDCRPSPPAFERGVDEGDAKVAFADRAEVNDRQYA
jgi:hypothetical protein